MLYLSLKALHIIAVISWMAGLLYLPRLFVYHADKDVGSEASETFKVMERRLLKAIMTPAMIVSWALGLWLGWQAEVLYDGWFIAKFIAVIGLTVCHFLFASWVRAFAEDRNRIRSRAFRFINEIPTLLMIAIVFLVVLKP